MGKSTISMAMFNSYFDITRGYFLDSIPMFVAHSSFSSSSIPISKGHLSPSLQGSELDRLPLTSLQGVMLGGAVPCKWTYNIIYPLVN